MNRTAHITIACDVDPDFNPEYRRVPRKEDPELNWRGITSGIPFLRQRLKETAFASKYGQPPLTWLLRSDRQIYELYGAYDFCSRQFEEIWKREREQGSEIGWHPHLHRWDEVARRWAPSLQKGDDLGLLLECLTALRRHTEIRAVRMGWDYQSNSLMQFLDSQGMLVDASAVPGCVQRGNWVYDWRSTPRFPYFPSEFDYRRPAKTDEESLNIVEMPVLVRSLKLPLRLIRHCLRNLRAIRNPHFAFTDWMSARWQGVTITGRGRLFREAAHQSFASIPEREDIFITTFFHAAELLSSKLLGNFLHNLQTLNHLCDELGYTISLATLSDAASTFKNIR